MKKLRNILFLALILSQGYAFSHHGNEQEHENDGAARQVIER